MAPRLLLLLLIVLFLSIGTLASENIYFYVSRAEAYCFVDELMQTATLLVSYKHEDFRTKPLQLVVTLNGQTIKTTRLDSREGRFAFAAQETGAYKLCIQPLEDKMGMVSPRFPPVGQAKVYLQTQVLANSVEEEAEEKLPPVAKQTQVVSLQEELTKVSETVEILLKKIQLARDRETHFRDQSERINERVVWWSIAQTVFLIIAGSFQSVHLHNFFLQKKIA